jgi:hypothetical protein
LDPLIKSQLLPATMMASIIARILVAL